MADFIQDMNNLLQAAAEGKDKRFERELSSAEWKKAWELCIRKLDENLAVFSHCFPGAASTGQLYQPTANDDWTNGFWTGELWLAYEDTKDRRFYEAAAWQVKDFGRRIREQVVTDHHDMGFLYSPSCVAACRLLAASGSKEDKELAAAAKGAAILAADNLMGRFQETGQFFQAWGRVVGSERNKDGKRTGDLKEYRLIIDCLLNMPLLFWASEVTGDSRYKEKACAHIRTAMGVAVKSDFSTYHTFYFDPETGAPVGGVTQQGNRDGSIWARGQAWGVYGSALGYSLLKDVTYRPLFEELAACFIKNLPDNLIPYWDFDFTDGSGEPADSSASAITACGLLEMADQLETIGEMKQAKGLRHIASCLVKALADYCQVKEETVSNGILLHGTYAKKSAQNGVRDSGVDECNLWGDYFFMEALRRLKGNWERFW